METSSASDEHFIYLNSTVEFQMVGSYRQLELKEFRSGEFAFLQYSLILLIEDFVPAFNDSTLALVNIFLIASTLRRPNILCAYFSTLFQYISHNICLSHPIYIPESIFQVSTLGYFRVRLPWEVLFLCQGHLTTFILGRTTSESVPP